MMRGLLSYWYHYIWLQIGPFVLPDVNLFGDFRRKNVNKSEKGYTTELIKFGVF